MSITEKWARQRESVWHLGGQNTHEISPEIKATRGSNFLTGGRLRNFFLRNQPIFWEILQINRSDELELTGLIGYRHECFLVLRDREPIIKEVWFKIPWLLLSPFANNFHPPLIPNSCEMTSSESDRILPRWTLTVSVWSDRVRLPTILISFGN